MKTQWFRVLLLAIICLSGFLPMPTFAVGVFDVPSTDKSMQYLGMVFGSVAGLPIQATGNAAFSQLIYIFNQIVFALGIVLVIVMTVMGTLSTAQEGEVMGKKWSSIIVPARAGIGVYLLLPHLGGYNWIQVGVLWFIIQGVGAANAIWTQLIYDSAREGSIVADTRNLDMANGAEAVKTIFTSVLCMEELNERIIARNPQATEGDLISIYRPFNDPNKIYFGQEADTSGKPACGAIELPNVGSSVAPSPGATARSDEQRKQIFADAIMSASSALQSSAQEALLLPSEDWSNHANLVSAARALKGATNAMTQTFTSLTGFRQQAIIDGWIHAGSYYFSLVTQGVYQNSRISLTGQGMDTQQIARIIGNDDTGTVVNKVTTTATAYMGETASITQTSSLQSRVGGQMGAVGVQPPGEVQGIFSAIFGSLLTDLTTMMTNITTGCMSDTTNIATSEEQLYGETLLGGGGYAGRAELGYESGGIGGALNEIFGGRQTFQNTDPLVCMANFGSDLANTIEIIFWTSLILMLAIFLAASFMSCVSPVAHALDFLVMLIIPIVTMIISLLWTIGISLALYVPLIPYIVFTFAALTWVILVIEALLGAPLIGLTLLIPSEDELGRAGHSIIILLGLFLRPALMILGFIFAMKLLLVAIGMLNFGFASSMRMSLGNLGLFGVISVLTVYAGVAIGIVHEAFSLIYILPDKVLRWMGGAGEGSEAGKHAKEMKGSTEAGAGIGKGIMTGATGFAGGKARGALAKHKK